MEIQLTPRVAFLISSRLAKLLAREIRTALNAVPASRMGQKKKKRTIQETTARRIVVGGLRIADDNGIFNSAMTGLFDVVS